MIIKCDWVVASSADRFAAMMSGTRLEAIPKLFKLFVGLHQINYSILNR
jgi:hypothetical protein